MTRLRDLFNDILLTLQLEKGREETKMPAPDQSQVHELLIERPPIAITATLVCGKLEQIHVVGKMVNPIGKRIVSTFSILQILQLHCNGEPSSASTSRVVVLAPDKRFLVLFWKKIVPQKSKQQLFIWDQYCHLTVMAPH